MLWNERKRAYFRERLHQVTQGACLVLLVIILHTHDLCFASEKHTVMTKHSPVDRSILFLAPPPQPGTRWPAFKHLQTEISWVPCPGCLSAPLPSACSSRAGAILIPNTEQKHHDNLAPLLRCQGTGFIKSRCREEKKRLIIIIY